MAKQTRKADNSQLSLFDYVKQAAAAKADQGPAPGTLDVDARLRAAVSADIKASPLSRAQIAAAMSDLVGEHITEQMLNSWTAEAKKRHRFPAAYLPAFVIATKGRRAFGTLSEASGLFALPGPEALRAEIQKIEEEILEKKRERRERLVLLGQVNGGD